MFKPIFASLILNYKKMKKTGITLLALILSAGLWAQTTKWQFDNAHTSIEFAIDHMVISEVTGKFSDFNGTVMSNGDAFEKAMIDFNIAVANIKTENTDRDDHLRGPDFFDVEKYPEITFKSTDFKKLSDKKYLLTGDLFMHGVTKKVDLEVSFGGIMTDPWGNTKAGFKLTGKINRKDFGLTWNKTLEAGGLLVGEEVSITARVQLVKSKE
jgi:polyisoprenoid-binding protein YceI